MLTPGLFSKGKRQKYHFRITCSLHSEAGIRNQRNAVHTQRHTLHSSANLIAEGHAGQGGMRAALAIF